MQSRQVNDEERVLPRACPPPSLGTSRAPAADLAGCARTLRLGAGRRGAAASTARLRQSFPGPSSRCSRAPGRPSTRRVTCPRSPAGRSAAAGARPGDSAPQLPSPEPGSPARAARCEETRDPTHARPPCPAPPPRRARRRSLLCPARCMEGPVRIAAAATVAAVARARWDDLGVAFRAGCSAGGLEA